MKSKNLHLKKTLIIFFNFLVPLFFYSQNNDSLNQKNTIILGLRTFYEIDKPFSLKKHKEANSYLYNFGYGLKVKYQYSINNKVSFISQTGIWYLWNNSENSNDIGIYKTRNIIYPLLLGIQIIPFNKYYLWFNIYSGIANNQYIQRYEKVKSNISSKSFPILEFNIGYNFNNPLKKGRYRDLGIGYGNEIINGRTFRNYHLHFKYFRF